ncbi:MAG: flippase-like domain-containing protein [Candidatus Aminicenantes bacterium]|nr:MAG: flippase-like domain-containing protein [Candidatus Aminicenantes bacterium]
MAKNKLFYILLSFAASIVLIWVLLSQINLGDLTKTFTEIEYTFLLIYIAIALSATGFRAWRYKLLLYPYSITWRNIILVTLIRNLFVDLLPARIGSLSYIYILNKRLTYSFEIATSTFVIAIIFDFLTLSPFLILAIFIVGLAATAISTLSLLTLSVLFFFVIFVILWRITQISSFLLKFYRLLLKLFNAESKRWAKLTIEKFHLTIEYLSEIKKKKIFGRILSLSFLIRLAKYGSLYFLLLSLLQSHGFSFKTLSFWKNILGITGAELSSALPVKGIAGFGTWESAWALTFKLMSFEKELAILSGIGVHLITNLFEYSLGILAIFILAFPLIKKTKKKKK